MIRCYKCGKRITSKTYWKKYYWKEEWVAEPKPICNDCAASLVDEHTTNGLSLAFNDEEEDQ